MPLGWLKRRESYVADNMKIWESVCHTDPKHTKKVNQRGGFTAVNAQHQLFEATKLWGPYGSSWGISECKWDLLQADGGFPVMILDAFFTYPGGSFPISADMHFKANDDCRKKLLTEARSKALSLLGFNADIFLGQWEDQAYVSAMTTKFGEADELVKKAMVAIRSADTEKKLTACRERIDGLFSNTAISKGDYNQLLEEIDTTRRELVDNGKL